MKLKFETSLDYFIFFIILIKIVFIISAIGHLILSHLNITQAENLDPTLVYWKERTEFIFIILMAILLIYQFQPSLYKKTIREDTSREDTSLLFFLFGWLLIITAKWSIFIHEAPWYKLIVSLFQY